MNVIWQLFEFLNQWCLCLEYAVSFQDLNDQNIAKYSYIDVHVYNISHFPLLSSSHRIIVCHRYIYQKRFQIGLPNDYFSTIFTFRLDGFSLKLNDMTLPPTQSTISSGTFASHASINKWQVLCLKSHRFSWVSHVLLSSWSSSQKFIAVYCEFAVAIFIHELKRIL